MDVDAIEKENFLIPRFGALCFFLATVEYIIPKPLPFLRLGIANFPLVIAAGFFPARAYFLLAIVKVLVQGITGGTFFSWIFLFSCLGTFSSAAIMFLFKRLLGKSISAVGLSTAGAFVSNGIQLAVAGFWIFGESILAVAPILLTAGIISGIIVGAFAEFFSRKSTWLAEIQAPGFFLKLSPSAPQKNKIPETLCQNDNGNKNSPLIIFRIAFGFSVAIASGFFTQLSVRAMIFLLFFTGLCFTKKRPRPVPVIITLVSITVFNLYPPCGQVLFQRGPFSITTTALYTGLSRAILFESLIFISRWTFLKGSFKFRRKKPCWRLPFLMEKTFSVFAELNSALPSLSKEKKKIRDFPAYMDKLLSSLEG